MILNKENIAPVLASDQFTDGEKGLAKWLCRMQGQFYTHLFNTIQNADPVHLTLLHYPYPGEVDAFRAWRDGDLDTRFAAAIGQPPARTEIVSTRPGMELHYRVEITEDGGFGAIYQEAYMTAEKAIELNHAIEVPGMWITPERLEQQDPLTHKP